MQKQKMAACLFLCSLPQVAFAAEATLDAWFSNINGVLAQVIFFDVFPGAPSMPLIVAC